MSPKSANANGNEWKGTERRRAKRKLLNETVLVSLPGQTAYKPYLLRDLTVFGAGLWLDGLTVVPAAFKLSFDGFRNSFECCLIWRQADRIGVSFT